MFFMVVAAVYILYLLFLIVRACSELRHMPYVGQCHFTNAQCSPGQEAASHGGGGGRSGWRPPSKWPDLQGKTQGLILFSRTGDQHRRSLGQQGRRDNSGPFKQRLRPAQEGGPWAGSQLGPAPARLWEPPGSFQPRTWHRGRWAARLVLESGQAASLHRILSPSLGTSWTLERWDGVSPGLQASSWGPFFVFIQDECGIYF